MATWFSAACRACLANSALKELTGSPSLYFKLNIAFTCAVTVTFCGVNSWVGGAGSACVRIIAIDRGGIGRGRIFSKVSTDA